MKFGPISLRRVRNIVAGIGVLILVFGLGYRYAEYRLKGNAPSVGNFLFSTQTDKVEGVDFGNFWDVWQRLERSYVDEGKINYQEMTWGAMQGLAGSLDDPYTQYLPPAKNKQSKEDLNGAFYGVGIELGYKNGQLAVMAPLEGTPAQRQGVKAGDLILHIKDESKGVDQDTQGMILTEAVQIIRGEKGKAVTLTLYRDGTEQPFEVSIERDEIVVPSVELKYIERDGQKFAHLKLNRYGGRTEDEWLEKVGEILANRVNGVIFDVRNNPGGYLDGAVFVGGEFLKEGIVVQQQGRDTTETFSVDRRGRLTDIPLVVLVNGGSASASEITAGAIQDHKRAQIVGEKTFGKGTVQEVQELRDGSSLHVTVAKWLLPSGRSIDKDGVTPDVEVTDNPDTSDVDEQLDRAVEVLLR